MALAQAGAGGQSEPAYPGGYCNIQAPALTACPSLQHGWWVVGGWWVSDRACPACPPSGRGRARSPDGRGWCTDDAFLCSFPPFDIFSGSLPSPVTLTRCCLLLLSPVCRTSPQVWPRPRPPNTAGVRHSRGGPGWGLGIGRWAGGSETGEEFQVPPSQVLREAGEGRGGGTR